MSDQDNLRDRIAEEIEGKEEYPHPRGYTRHAQAIIDSLDLHVVEHVGDVHRVAGSWTEEA